jgi:hypothetical protein
MRTPRGAAGVSSGVRAVVPVGGGGVLGTGVFFLHPAADTIKAAANTATASVLETLRIFILSRIFI